jgi:hypothetical protein
MPILVQHTQDVEMTTEAWVKMMFLDGCFILKHLCNSALGINETELRQLRWAPAQLRSDLTLLENEIPFAVRPPGATGPPAAQC